MEQEDADILIGPLSGDEGIAVANYAKEHPDKTFINGTSGAQDTTLKVQAPNFFRFHSDGAQWSAGLGEYAYNELGWKTAAVIGDDYSFPYTSLAGFVAEFCAVGGKVTKRIWPPLGEKDYSSFISQIPDDVDGIYYGIGGAGLVSFMKQYQEQRGKIDPKKTMGNVFFDDPLVLKEVSNAVDRFVHGRPDGGGLQRAGRGGLRQALEDAYGKEISGLAASVFVYNYYTAAWALIKGLEEVNGDISDQSKLQEALTWRHARRAVGRDQARRQPQRRRGQLRQGDRPRHQRRQGAGREDRPSRPGRRADVRRHVHRRYAASGPHEPEVRGRRASPVGRQVRRGRLLVEVGAVAAPATSTDSAAPILRLAGVGRRFGGVHAVRGVDLEVRPGERRAILGPNGAGKTTLFNLISGEFPPTAGTVELFGGDVTGEPARKRARIGLSRTFQTSRLFLGLSVEDNLYLSVLGVHGGHFRLLKNQRDSEMRDKAPRDGGRRRPRRRARRARVRALPRRAAPARGGDGARERPQADDARRAGRRPVARRAREAHRHAAQARSGDHADPDRARHGRGPARRRVGDDDARRPRDRRRYAGRDPRQPDRPRPVPRERDDQP